MSDREAVNIPFGQRAEKIVKRHIEPRGAFCPKSARTRLLVAP